MKNQTKNLDMIAGFLTCLVLIAYFLIMKYTNLVQIVELRAFNFCILLCGINISFYYKMKYAQHKLEYFNGFQTGVYTALYTVIPFSVFIFIYLSKIDPYLITQFKSHTILTGKVFSPETIAETVFTEGIVSGTLLTFILIHYYRKEFSESVSSKRIFKGNRQIL